MTAQLAPDTTHAPEPVVPLVTAPRPAPFGAKVAARGLLLFAAGVLGFVGYLVFLSPLQQSAEQDVLYSQLRGPLAEGIPPYAGRAEGPDGTVVRDVPPIYDDGEDTAIPAGAPVAVLEIPAIGLRQVVVEGTGAADLELGPGHRRNTPLPGQEGVSLIYGRAATFGGPFADLPQVRRGQTLTVVTFQGTFTYRVEGVRREGDPLPDVEPVKDGGSRLTLVTAEGDNPLQPNRIVYVDALLRGDAQPAAERPRLVPPEERALAFDGPALLPLVLWMQALVAVAIAIAWARVRWGRWETHLVGLPLALAVLWQVYESGARLLPNLT
jgi:sortase A